MRDAKNMNASTSWHSYPKVYNLGHPAIADLLDGELVIEEKIDGSQFSFGTFGGELRIKSKGADIQPDAPPAMFAKAVDTVKAVRERLVEGFTYRGEVLNSPKHNTLCYGRVPAGNIIIFDVNPGQETYLLPALKRAAAGEIGLETVTEFFEDITSGPERLLKLLDTQSILGGSKIEGLIIKNYGRFGRDGKALMGKYVSEVFKETHAKEWKRKNPSSNDYVDSLAQSYRMEARWQKAVQRLRDMDLLDNSPTDIGKLIREVERDVKYECEEEIKHNLFEWAWTKIARKTYAGLPEWYKKKLLEKQFQHK